MSAAEDREEPTEPSPDSGADPSPAGEAAAKEWRFGEPLSARAHFVAGLFGPLLVASINMWRLHAFTIDDAYISFRYARNLARGLGLVYNPGQHIEGYTNFLWTVLLALFAKIGLDPVIAAKVLGAASGLSAVALLFHLERELVPLSALPALSPWLLATTTAFMGYSVFGLETALFLALVLAGIALILREEVAEGFPWSGVVFGLAGLTRPEAPMYLGLMMLFLPGRALFGWRRREPDHAARPGVMALGIAGLCAAALIHLDPTSDRGGYALAPWLLGAFGAVAVASELPREFFSPRNLLRGGSFVAIVAAHMLWRHHYYGSWLPNTLTAKTGDLRQQLAGGLDYLKRYAAHEGPLLIFPLFGIGVAIAKKHRHMLGFCAIAACVTSYIAVVGGDWMPMHRFATALQPVLYLLAAVGVRAVVEEKSAQVNWGIGLIALIAGGYRADRIREDRAKILTDEKGFWDRAAGGVSAWFAEAERERGRDAVAGDLALGDIGEVGYKTNYPIVDLLGLVDPVVAKLPGGYTNKVGPGFRDYFFGKEPRYFILISANNDCVHPSVTGSIAIYHDPRFREDYGLSGRVILNGGFSWCVYERRDEADRSRPLLVYDGTRFFSMPRPDARER